MLLVGFYFGVGEMSTEIYYSRDGEIFNDDCVEDLDLEIGDTYYFGES